MAQKRATVQLAIPNDHPVFQEVMVALLNSTTNKGRIIFREGD